MIKFIIAALAITAVIAEANATQPTGKISGISFYGSGVNEVMFVTIDPKSSACPYAGAYVLPSKDRTGITSALIAAFQAQNTVTIFGTGLCHTAWSNHEELNYAAFRR